MALYLGNKKVKLHMGAVAYVLHVLVSTLTSAVGLVSSDGYILKDSNGLILAVREGD